MISKQPFNPARPKSPAMKSALASIAQTCPICGQSSNVGYKPFCSKRCADVDLHRWSKGVYKIPGTANT